MSAPVDVLAVMDADGRAVALLSDEYHGAGKAKLAEQWSDHLSVHDKARAAVAELIEAAGEMNRLAKGPPGGVSQADKRSIIARMDAALARVRGGAA